jgi:hypothetical protein
MCTTCPAHFVLDFVAILMSVEDKLCISSLHNFTSSYYFSLGLDVLSTTLSYTLHVLLLSGRSSFMPILYKHVLCAQEGKSGVQTWNVQWEPSPTIQLFREILAFCSYRTTEPFQKYREIVLATHTCFRFQKETKKKYKKKNIRLISSDDSPPEMTKRRSQARSSASVPFLLKQYSANTLRNFVFCTVHCNT